VVVTAADAAGTATTEDTTFTTLKPQNLIEVTFQANAMLALKEGHVRRGPAGDRRVQPRRQQERGGEGHRDQDVARRRGQVLLGGRPDRALAAGEILGRRHDGQGERQRHVRRQARQTACTAKNASTHFTIGRQLIAITDNRTHLTKVYIDGKLVRTMKCSLGKGGGTTGANGEQHQLLDRGRPHVVLSKERCTA
jgi:hypothetical protein